MYVCVYITLIMYDMYN